MASHLISGTLSDELAAHRILLDLRRSNVDRTKAYFLFHFVENWCTAQCIGDWKVENDDSTFSVSFELDQDCVVFHLTEEFDYMQSRPNCRLM